MPLSDPLRKSFSTEILSVGSMNGRPRPSGRLSSPHCRQPVDQDNQRRVTAGGIDRLRVTDCQWIRRLTDSLADPTTQPSGSLSTNRWSEPAARYTSCVAINIETSSFWMLTSEQQNNAAPRFPRAIRPRRHGVFARWLRLSDYPRMSRVE